MQDDAFAPLSDQLVRKAFAIAQQAGGQGRLVGGAVRDWLMGRQIGDLDMAVNVPIAAFRKTASDQGIRVIDTGLAHGSVTLVDARQTLEVTQTRTDISTDGRHAQIGFTSDWEEDASRRDFTMNALYIDQTGKLYDPLGGQEDIAANKVRFIGQAGARITEDYLRILRLVRFISQLDGFSADQADLDEIPNHLDGLRQLSGERIISEIQKLFAGAQWPNAVALMRQTDIDQALFGEAFLPLSDHAARLQTWQSALASCVGTKGASAVACLPFSRADLRYLDSLWQPFAAGDFAKLAAEQGQGWQMVAYFNQTHLYERAMIQARCEEASMSEARLETLRSYAAPPCPVRGDDLSKAGVAPGPYMGDLLAKAAGLFVKSGFKMSADDIVQQLIDSGEIRNESDHG